MTPEIDVTEEPSGSFRVVLRAERQTTTHDVRVTPAMAESLGWSGPYTDLVHQSFLFLLERESQTSILRAFDLDVIGRYFPEYPEEIRRRGSGGQRQSP